MAVDALGNVLVSDQRNNRIQKFGPPTSTALTPNPNPSGDGQSIALTASVTPAAASGTVTFYDGGLPLTSAPLSGGLAVVSATFSGIGTHSLTAVYGGSSDYVPSTSPPVLQSVIQNQFPPSFISKWGTQGGGDGQFWGPIGIATDRSGYVYVTDGYNNRVEVFDNLGNYFRQWGSFGNGNGNFGSPAGIAVSSDGYVYVVDMGNGRVQKFTGNGAYVTQWGSFGSADSQFNSPVGIAVDSQGNVYVSDNGKGAVQKYTSGGIYLQSIGAPFTLVGPIAVGPGDVLYAAVSGSHIAAYARDGTYLRQFGEYGSGNGQFREVTGLAVDPRGSVLVLESNTESGYGRVQKFTSAGTYITQWGSSGSGNGQFDYAWGMTVDGSGAIFVVEWGNNRVQKFQYLHRILSITDVRYDQGGRARMTFSANGADFPGSSPYPIVNYQVFRFVKNYPAPSVGPAGRPSRGLAPSAQLFGWDSVATVPAYGDSVYSVIVPTVLDSGSTGTHYAVYFIRAFTAYPYFYCDCLPDSGYSVDNLAPPPPAGLGAVSGGGVTLLHWNACTVPDFATFRVYRGASADFLPAPGSLLAITTDTSYADAAASAYYYKLSAVDRSGNESGFAMAHPQGATAAPDLPRVMFLEPGAPNPARRNSTVQFGLPSAAEVSLQVLDVTGRVIRELLHSTIPAGTHSRTWDLRNEAGQPVSSGMYFLRLNTPAGSRSRRVLVLR